MSHEDVLLLVSAIEKLALALVLAAVIRGVMNK